jgi:hypothetical protein
MDTIEKILADAKAGIDVRHRATLLGRQLSGDQRDQLFHDIERLLGEARIRGHYREH